MQVINNNTPIAYTQKVIQHYTNLIGLAVSWQCCRCIPVLTSEGHHTWEHKKRPVQPTIAQGTTAGSEKALQKDAGLILSASDVNGIKVRGQLIPALATSVHMG